MHSGVAVVHVSIVLMRVVIVERISAVLVDRELCRGHACTEDALGAHGTRVEGEAAKRRPKVLERKTSVEKRTEHHIAGDAGEAVEIQHARH
jgi:hypothetical protein